MRTTHRSFLFFLTLLFLCGSGSAAEQPTLQRDEIDVFMEQVLEQREISWDELYD